MGAIAYMDEIYGSGSSGHTILDNTGQAVTPRSNLQFGKSVVTDDSTNGITKINVNNAIEKTYAQFQNMTPTERADGSVYYIPDYPTLGNVFFFRTVDAMQAAIQHGDVPNNAICITTADYPYEAKAEDVTYDNTDSGLAADNIQDAVDEVVSDLNGKQAALTNPLTQSDVVNNLTSTATNVPLSAAMGKALQSKINQRFQKTLATNPNGVIDLLQDQDWVNFYDINTMYIIFALPLGINIYAVVGSRDPFGYPWIKVMNYDNTPIANSSVNILIYCNRI